MALSFFGCKALFISLLTLQTITANLDFLNPDSPFPPSIDSIDPPGLAENPVAYSSWGGMDGSNSDNNNELDLQAPDQDFISVSEEDHHLCASFQPQQSQNSAHRPNRRSDSICTPGYQVEPGGQQPANQLKEPGTGTGTGGNLVPMEEETDYIRREDLLVQPAKADPNSEICLDETRRTPVCHRGYSEQESPSAYLPDVRAGRLIL